MTDLVPQVIIKKQTAIERGDIEFSKRTGSAQVASHKSTSVMDARLSCITSTSTECCSSLQSDSMVSTSRLIAIYLYKYECLIASVEIGFFSFCFFFIVFASAMLSTSDRCMRIRLHQLCRAEPSSRSVFQLRIRVGLFDSLWVTYPYVNQIRI